MNDSTALPFDASVGGASPASPSFNVNEEGVATPTKKKRAPWGSRTRNGAPLTETPVVQEGADDAAPGEKPSRRKRTKPIDATAWAKQIQGMHMLLAKMVPIQYQGRLILEIDDKESTQLATAIADVCREYNIELGGKVGAGFTLIATAAMIYGPRVYLVKQMQLQAQRAAQQPVRPEPQSPLEVANARAAKENGAATATAN